MVAEDAAFADDDLGVKLAVLTHLHGFADDAAGADVGAIADFSIGFDDGAGADADLGGIQPGGGVDIGGGVDTGLKVGAGFHEVSHQSIERHGGILHLDAGHAFGVLRECRGHQHGAGRGGQEIVEVFFVAEEGNLAGGGAIQRCDSGDRNLRSRVVDKLATGELENFGESEVHISSIGG